MYIDLESVKFSIRASSVESLWSPKVFFWPVSLGKLILNVTDFLLVETVDEILKEEHRGASSVGCPQSVWSRKETL